MLRTPTSESGCPFCNLFWTFIALCIYCCVINKRSVMHSALCSGKSFMNKIKRVGPSTEPWGTPVVTTSHPALKLPETVPCDWSVKYELELCNLYAWSFCINMARLIRSNSFLRSRNSAPMMFPSSMFFNQESTNLIRAVWQEWFYRKPEWKKWIRWYLFRYPRRCLTICLSNTLETTEKNRYRSIVRRNSFVTCFMDWNHLCYFSKSQGMYHLQSLYWWE